MAGTYKTADAETASSSRLQYVDVYMGDLLCAAQGDPTQQQRFSDITIRDLKEILPIFPDKVKGSSSLKEALARDGDWDMAKEILVWVIDTRPGTLALSYKLRLEILSILATPPNQRHASTKKLERLVRKIRSMHLALPWANRHFYAM